MKTTSYQNTRSSLLCGKGGVGILSSEHLVSDFGKGSIVSENIKVVSNVEAEVPSLAPNSGEGGTNPMSLIAKLAKWCDTHKDALPAKEVSKLMSQIIELDGGAIARVKSLIDPLASRRADYDKLVAEYSEDEFLAAWAAGTDRLVAALVWNGRTVLAVGATGERAAAMVARFQSVRAAAFGARVASESSDSENRGVRYSSTVKVVGKCSWNAKRGKAKLGDCPHNGEKHVIEDDATVNSLVANLGKECGKDGFKLSHVNAVSFLAKHGLAVIDNEPTTDEPDANEPTEDA